MDKKSRKQSIQKNSSQILFTCTHYNNPILYKNNKLNSDQKYIINKNVIKIFQLNINLTLMAYYRHTVAYIIPYSFLAPSYLSCIILLYFFKPALNKFSLVGVQITDSRRNPMPKTFLRYFITLHQRGSMGGETIFKNSIGPILKSQD